LYQFISQLHLIYSKTQYIIYYEEIRKTQFGPRMYDDEHRWNVLALLDYWENN